MQAMINNRRPADIADDLRGLADIAPGPAARSSLLTVAVEVEALPVLTVKEIADMRRGVDRALRASAHDEDLHHFATDVAAILDRIDPPTVVDGHRRPYPAGTVVRVGDRLVMASDDEGAVVNPWDGMTWGEMTEFDAAVLVADPRDTSEHFRSEVERLTAERDEARRWGIEQRDEREWPWAHTDDGLRRKRMTPAEAWPPPWATEGEGT